MGSKGVESLAELICTQLETIIFNDCSLGEDGWQALADASESLSHRSCYLRSLKIKQWSKALPALQVTELEHIRRFAKQCPTLEAITVPNETRETITANANLREYGFWVFD